MELTLYFGAMSQPARSVLMFLEANEIPHEKKVINVRKGEHLTNKEFMTVNPLKTIPALKHGDFCLGESTAILRYLHSAYKCRDHWYPKDLQKRAKIDEYLAWHHLNIRMGLAMIFRTEVLIPRITGKPINEEMLSKYTQLGKDSTSMLESYFLSKSKFISSDAISIADLMAVTEFSQLEVTSKDHLGLSSRVKEWIQDCKNELSPHYDEVHKVVYHFKAMLSKPAKL